MKRQERVQKLAARNAEVIDAFRANGGDVDIRGYGRNLVIMHTIGAKSGQLRPTPVFALSEGDGWIVLAAVGGWPTNPDWYHNLVANPEIDVEYPGVSDVETTRVRVHEATDEEWEAEFPEVAKRFPGLEDMQEKTARRIPILHLRRIGSAG